MEQTARKGRDLSTREVAERPKQWMPPQLLPDPIPEAGYAYRWIRIASLGKDDATNISGKLREGWEPVRASDHPEIRLFGSSNPKFPDCVEVGGLLLCKTPVEFTEQRNVDITCIQDCTVAAVVPDQITGGNGIDIE